MVFGIEKELLQRRRDKVQEMIINQPNDTTKLRDNFHNWDHDRVSTKYEKAPLIFIKRTIKNGKP